jgi:hypothetical protein
MTSSYKLCNTFNALACGTDISQAIVTACIIASPNAFFVVPNIQFHVIFVTYKRIVAKFITVYRLVVRAVAELPPILTIASCIFFSPLWQIEEQRGIFLV